MYLCDTGKSFSLSVPQFAELLSEDDTGLL